MLRTIRTFILLSFALDAIAFGIFLFTDERGLHGYATVLIYCSMGVAILAGLALMGSSGPRRAHDEHLHFTVGDEEARRIDHADRERGVSFGLILFVVALLSGTTGYVLANITHP